MGYLPVIPCVFMKYRWIFEQFFGIFSVLQKYRIQKKIPKNYENITGISKKTHGITVLSYNYLIFSHHNVFYRQLKGVKRDFFKCMYVLCSSSMMNANVNNSELHNTERQQ